MLKTSVQFCRLRSAGYTCGTGAMHFSTDCWCCAYSCRKVQPRRSVGDAYTPVAGAMYLIMERRSKQGSRSPCRRCSSVPRANLLGGSLFEICCSGPQHTLVPPAVCGSWPLLKVWDSRFPWVYRQPTTHSKRARTRLPRSKSVLARTVRSPMELTPSSCAPNHRDHILAV